MTNCVVEQRNKNSSHAQVRVSESSSSIFSGGSCPANNIGWIRCRFCRLLRALGSANDSTSQTAILRYAVSQLSPSTLIRRACGGAGLIATPHPGSHILSFCHAEAIGYFACYIKPLTTKAINGERLKLSQH